MAQKAEQNEPGSNAMLLLGMISEEDKYGFQLIRELEEHNDRSFRMHEGDIYPILHMLEDHGELRSYEKSVNEERMRRYYAITKQGIKTLAQCRRAWENYRKLHGKVVGGEACVRR